MYIICLDFEGVVAPEMWVAYAKVSGISQLTRTTRDEPDYDKLMNWRLGILNEHGQGLNEIQNAISTCEPLPGAKEFLDELRGLAQTVIVSDTFEEFAKPLIEKLGRPTILCHSLEVTGDGTITGYNLRIKSDTKLNTIKALQSIGYKVIAAGDSYNDLDMIKNAEHGFLFRSTEQIKKENPDIPAFEEYDDLLKAIKSVIRK